MDRVLEILQKSQNNNSNTNNDNDDDDGLSLRPDTLLALQEFLKEKQIQEEKEKQETQLLDTATLVTSEDWQLSQFWYDESTAVALAKELLAVADDIRKERTTTSNTPTSTTSSSENNNSIVTIACISCPSVYKALLSIGIPSNTRVYILEYDKRFNIFGDAYFYYDFNYPLTIPTILKDTCDIIILDPPFLNYDTLSNFTQTVEVMKTKSTSLSLSSPRILLCTGAIMLPHAKKLLNLRPTQMNIHHNNRLSNPFALYTNYMVTERLIGWDIEAEQAVNKEEINK